MSTPLPKRHRRSAATIMVPPQDIPTVGRFCWLRDPQGALVAIITYAQGAGA